jgi:hypothetical protein
MKESKRLEIERFVKGTLGCSCPEEVFRQVELETATEPSGTGLMTRLVIGRKLLVYVAVPSASMQFPRQLVDLARHGRRERDEKGLNRFRLALVSYGCAATEKRVREAMDGMLEGDDRAHVHVVQRTDVPTLLLPGSTVLRPARRPATLEQ